MQALRGTIAEEAADAHSPEGAKPVSMGFRETGTSVEPIATGPNSKRPILRSAVPSKFT